MPVPDWLVWIIGIILVIFPAIVIVFFVYALSDIILCRKVRTKAFRALINTFKVFVADSDYEFAQCECELILKTILPNCPALVKRYPTLPALIEDFIARLNTGTITCEDNPVVLRKAIFNFMQRYRCEHPLEELNGLHYAILKDLIDTSDPTKHLERVKAVAAELKKRDDEILRLQLSTRTGTVLSVAGIALTVLFGIIAIIQAL